MILYECPVCGYVYDPQAGEGQNAPGTDFSELPPKWECPICATPKEAFFQKEDWK